MKHLLYETQRLTGEEWQLASKPFEVLGVPIDRQRKLLE
jgi:hypothetical protein